MSEIKFITLEQYVDDLDKQRNTFDNVEMLRVHADSHIKQIF